MGSVLKELVKGAIAVAVSVWMMGRVTWYMYKNEDPKACKKEKEAQIEGKYVSSVAADKIARAVGAKLSERQEYWAGQTIHYALGIAPSALYAVYRHRVKGLHAGWGLLYGLGLFIPE
jgi:hypothetical protein